MRWSLFAIVALALAASPSIGEEPAVVELGGVRRVSVTIKAEAGQFEVVVRMLPVRCFDNATNARLNREKAKGFAFQTLIRHLDTKGDRTSRAVVSGATVRTASTDGQFFALTLTVPRNGVRLLEANSAADEPSETLSQVVVLSAKSLLGRRDDYASTVIELADLFQRGAEGAATADFDSEGDFRLAIADLEERADAQFEWLKTEVESDKLLLTVEKDELIRSVSAEQERFVNRLRKVVEGRERAKGKERDK